MRSIIVYYSRTGTTKKLGEAIAKALSSSTLEIIDMKNRSGPLGYLTGGKDAVTRKLTPIKPVNEDLSKYDLVVVGTPVWASNMAPAIRTILTEKKGSIKNTAFFCTAGEENAGKTFSEMQELTSAPIATLQLTTNEVKGDKYFEKLEEFLKKLK